MNYYEHHLGDYAAATAHLSWDEDMAYSRLLRAYYHHERGIPDGQQYRLARATTPAQRRAVDTVLGEFFVLADGVYRQARCEREIQRYAEGEPEREVKKRNEANRLSKHRQERAALFKTLTEAGHHAPWNIAMGDLRALVAGLSATSLQSPPVTAPETPPATAPATPATATNTNTNTSNKRTPPAPPARPPSREDPARRKTGTPDFLVTGELQRWCKEECPLVDARAETAAFRDNEFGIGHLDWPATWKNWMRREQKKLAAEQTREQRRDARIQARKGGAPPTHKEQFMQGIFGKPEPANQPEPKETLDGLTRLVDR